MSEKKYYLSVFGIFKNEELNLREWVEHYKHHGVDHIYLINDNSTDNSMDVLQPYIEEGYIEVFFNTVPKIQNRQSLSYNEHFLPLIKHTTWGIISDIDEFLYSPLENDLKQIFKQYEDKGAVSFEWVCFDSNKNISHPKSIVRSCTKRVNYKQTAQSPFNAGEQWGLTGPKYAFNTNFSLESLGVHGCHTSGPVIHISQEQEILLMNHYTTQSREFWETCKMTRGDVNCWHADDARGWNYFNALEIATINDFRLYEQNKCLFS
jgi:hypothetical protein